MNKYVKNKEVPEGLLSHPKTVSINTVWGAASLVGLATAIIFTAWPHIDLSVAGLFYRGDHRFLLVNNAFGDIPRALFRIMFVLFAGYCLIGLYWSLARRKSLFGFSFPHWIYLIACLIIGPGLVTNSLLKDHWGRARPVQVEQFGGSSQFTPPLTPSTACDRNCSFVSGESSSIFMLFFALALIATRQRRNLLKWGLVVGGLAGLMRIGMGGHFLSDVIFSGVFMMLTASFLYWMIFTLAARPLADRGPVHIRLIGASGMLRRRLRKLFDGFIEFLRTL